MAIISALGHSASIFRIGFTVFNNTGGDIPVDGWGLDDVASNKAAEILGARYQIVQMKYERADFLGSGALSLFNDGDPALGPIIRSLPTEGVDAYVVIRKTSWWANYPYNFRLQGLGVARWAGMHRGRPLVHAILEIDVLQAGTGKTLASRFSYKASMFPRTEPFDDTSAEEPLEDWADSPAKMTPEQLGRLHAHLADLVADTVARTLTNMGFAFK